MRTQSQLFYVLTFYIPPLKNSDRPKCSFHLFHDIFGLIVKSTVKQIPYLFPFK